MSAHPLGIGADLRSIKSIVHVVDELLPVAGRRSQPVACGALSAAGCTRSSFMLESTRASIAAAMVGMGTAEIERDLRGPLASPFLPCLVQHLIDERRPGLVDPSPRKIFAVISMRNDSSGPWFHSSKIVGELARVHAQSHAAAFHTPRRSAACRRTRCRCAPSSRNGRRRPDRRV